MLVFHTLHNRFCKHVATLPASGALTPSRFFSSTGHPYTTSTLLHCPKAYRPETAALVEAILRHGLQRRSEAHDLAGHYLFTSLCNCSGLLCAIRMVCVCRSHMWGYRPCLYPCLRVYQMVIKRVQVLGQVIVI